MNDLKPVIPPPVKHHRDEYTFGTRNPTVDIFVAERPWGSFKQFVSNETVTVKTITVQPGHRLSLQQHEHRGEMWHVLDVPIQVTVDGVSWSAEVGDTVWVPRGSVHRIANVGDTAGRILEVGFGFFDESDIVRLEDDYARPDPPVDSQPDSDSTADATTSEADGATSA
ncbi:MAG: phosphomannose isomerase type II C-terminal cupin domain [Candidatus Phosphoribacter sp.]